MMMMKRTLLIAGLAATARAFAPASNAGRPSSSIMDTNTIVGDFYGELHQNNNYILPKNAYFPKAVKKVKGDFYGELQTQKELKVPKPQAVAAAATELPRPEAAMTTTAAAAAVVTPPEAREGQAAVAGPVVQNA